MTGVGPMEACGAQLLTRIEPQAERRRGADSPSQRRFKSGRALPPRPRHVLGRIGSDQIRVRTLPPHPLPPGSGRLNAGPCSRGSGRAGGYRAPGRRRARNRSWSQGMGIGEGSRRFAFTRCGHRSVGGDRSGCY